MNIYNFIADDAIKMCMESNKFQVKKKRDPRELSQGLKYRCNSNHDPPFQERSSFSSPASASGSSGPPESL